MIRPATPEDAAQICEIYNHYVRETVVTFEESPVSAAEMSQRIGDITQRLPWLVWDEEGKILGYAYASPWKARAAYRHSVEASIYLPPHATGRGIGTGLYQALIEHVRKRGIHAVIGGAALPNPASVALHERLGFEKIGQFRQVGFKLGRWVDVGYWELLLPGDLNAARQVRVIRLTLRKTASSRPSIDVKRNLRSPQPLRFLLEAGMA